MIELRCGRFPLAADYAERSREIERQYMIGDREEPDIWFVALIAAHRGELDLARSLTESNRPLTDTHAIGRSGDEGVLGLVELWSGRPDEAAARFAAADADRRGIGINEPAMFWWRADYAEALLGMRQARRGCRTGRGLGSGGGAARPRSRARGNDALPRPPRGRSGRPRRRAGQARASGRTARGGRRPVRTCAGAPCARNGSGGGRARNAQPGRRSRQPSRASRLAGRPGGRRRPAPSSGRSAAARRIEGLTPAEGRIAALVAEGRTNREVAAALFLTEHTVATALTRVYRKLGVRSRTELARLAQTQDADSGKDLRFLHFRAWSAVGMLLS